MNSCKQIEIEQLVNRTEINFQEFLEYAKLQLDSISIVFEVIFNTTSVQQFRETYNHWKKNNLLKAYNICNSGLTYLLEYLNDLFKVTFF